MSKLDKWADFLPAEELATYAKGKFGEKVGFGKRVALLNIDTTYMFVDPAFPQCGDGDPELVANITRLVIAFRDLELPIYYSRRDDRSHPIRRGMWNDKLGIAGDMIYSGDPKADEWPNAYAPREQDVVVFKNKASCFSRRHWKLSCAMAMSIPSLSAAFRPVAASARRLTMPFHTISGSSLPKRRWVTEARPPIGPIFSTWI